MKQTKRKGKRALSILLALALVISGWIPYAGPEQVEAADYGISNPVVADAVTTWDTIYFGNYYQSSSTKKEPIRWRVLHVDGDEAFLLADKNLDCQPYNNKGVEKTDVDEDGSYTYTDYSCTWETCTLRTWLNDDFFKAAFSDAEQSAIKTSTVVNEDSPQYKTEGGNNTQDKIFLLSLAEACNPAYGFNSEYGAYSETRVGINTEYAKKRGVVTESPTTGSGWWWLRTPGYGFDPYYRKFVNDYGHGHDDGSVITFGHAVRPVLCVNLSSSSWKKGEKVTANWGEGSGNHTPDPIPTPAPNPNNGKGNGTSAAGTNGTNKSAAGTSVNPAPITTGHSTYKVSGNAATVTAADKKAKSVTIKDTVTIGGKTYKVTAVAAGAFQNCTKLTKVTIGKNIETIGANAFSGCKKLKTVTIGKDVKIIGKNAFKNCKKLKTIKIKGSVTKIAKGAFKGIKKNATFRVPKKYYKKLVKLIKKSGAKKPKIKKA